MQTRIRLAELLTRDVAVEWFEGVALVQSLRRECARTGREEFPSAAHVRLSADGTVSADGAASGRGAAAAAHLLAQMLSDDVPVRLRLILSQAAEGAGYPTLAELGDALGYFERPNPEGILQDLYARAVAAQPRKEPHGSPAAPEPREPEASAPPEPARRGVSRAPILAVAVLGILSAAVWLAQSADHVSLSALVASVRERVAPEAAPSTDTDDAAGTGLEPAARRDALSAGTVRGRAHQESGAAEIDENRGAALLSPPDAPTSGVTIFPPAQSTAHAAHDSIVIVDDAVVVVESSRAVFEGPDGAETSGGPIYSLGDAGVTPPLHVYPKFPRHARLPADRREHPTIMELVIDTTGEVEHVRLQTPPRDVREFMLVSAAKAWRFEPATVQGRPVRFLHTIALGGW